MVHVSSRVFSNFGFPCVFRCFAVPCLTAFDALFPFRHCGFRSGEFPGRSAGLPDFLTHRHFALYSVLLFPHRASLFVMFRLFPGRTAPGETVSFLHRTLESPLSAVPGLVVFLPLVRLKYNTWRPILSSAFCNFRKNFFQILRHPKTGPSR